MSRLVKAFLKRYSPVYTPDRLIIDQCLNGDTTAFGFLVEKYKAGVFAHAYAKLGNFQDAEDLAQEVFVKAYEKLSTFRRWDSFHAWLYSITSNACKRWLRSNQKGPWTSLA